MRRINKIMGGKRARAEGKFFEDIVEKYAFQQGIYPVRLPDGCRSIGGRKIARIKTALDWILVKNGCSVFVDCKSFDSDRITQSQLADHQVRALHNIENAGCVSGYLIWLREANRVCFVRASELICLEPGKSISWVKMYNLGTIEKFNLDLLFGLDASYRPEVMSG